jgi:hypothetical protein
MEGVAPLRAEFEAQLRHAFKPPFEVPLVVAINGALMSGCWFLLPASVTSWLFTLHGPIAFAMVLAGWMYSDVPATNVLGSDAARALEVLDDPEALRRLIVAKNLVLWVLIVPVCLVVAVGIGLYQQQWPPTVLSIVVIVVVPFGALGLSCWVGVRWPYHPIALTDRWEHRRPLRRKLVRWMILVTTPYWLVPLIAAVLALPSIALWAWVAHHGLSGRLSTGEYGLGVLIAVAIAVAAWVGGHRAAVKWAQRRRDELAAYLADPQQG